MSYFYVALGMGVLVFVIGGIVHLVIISNPEGTRDESD